MLSTKTGPNLYRVITLDGFAGSAKLGCKNAKSNVLRRHQSRKATMENEHGTR